jgi:GTP-binding protein
VSEPPCAEAIEAGRRLFARACTFMLGVARMEQLPAPGPVEVGFAGRSNVGKSSLVNALTGRKALARVSATPGATRQLNFFDLAGRLRLVDLPGYGYARASRGEVDSWTRLIHDFLRGRAALRRVCVLIDARHGIKPVDREIFKLLDEAAQGYQIVLTKADKVPPPELARMLATVTRETAGRGACHPEVLVTSAATGQGIAELRAALASLSGPG